jgi:hypothetical protein
MTTNDRYAAKYLLRLELAQAEQVAAFRAARGFRTEAETLRHLINRGLQANAVREPPVSE